MATPDPEVMLERIETDGVNLTTWEETFIERLRDQLNQYGTLKLTVPQTEALERIYADRTP